MPPTTLRTEAGRRGGRARRRRHAGAAAALPPAVRRGRAARVPRRPRARRRRVGGGRHVPAHAAAAARRGDGARSTSRRPRATDTSSPRCGCADPRDLGPAVARLRRLLDLDADPLAVDAVLGADPGLAPAVAAVPGIRLPGTVDGVETALRAVLGQQVSVAAARTAAQPAGRRARRAAARPRSPASGPDLLFPTPAAIAERGAEVLTGPRGGSRPCSGSPPPLADGSLVLDAGRDPADLRADAHRAARHRAVDGRLPGDAACSATPTSCSPPTSAVRRGAAALGLPSDLAGLTARAAGWAPWRSYAAIHLWRAMPATPRTGGPHEHRTWSTIDTPVGPFTAVVDADGAVLASGWTADARRAAPAGPPDAAADRRSSEGDLGAGRRRDHPLPRRRPVRDRRRARPAAVGRVPRARVGRAADGAGRRARSPTPSTRPRPGARRPCGRRPRPAPATRRPCSCRATGCCAPTAPLGGFRWGLEVKRWLLAHEAPRPEQASTTAFRHSHAHGAHCAIHAAIRTCRHLLPQSRLGDRSLRATGSVSTMRSTVRRSEPR